MTAGDNFESFKSQDDLNKESATAAESNRAFLDDIRKMPELKNEAGKEKLNPTEASEAFEKMSPTEHLDAFRTHMENALKLYNSLPKDWQNTVSSANFESGTIKPGDLGDPTKIRGLMSSLERAVNDKK